MFDRVYVINLDRRPDRLERFRATFPSSWPFRRPERIAALDGDRLGKPRWYSQQPGAWGCLRTHLQLIEQAINADQNIFIFEDDVVFAPDFNQRVENFFASVPDDWEMIYLGGLHRMPASHPPVAVGDGIALGRAITTTFAYGLRAGFLRRVYPQLLETEQHHIDQIWARLQMAHSWRIYCPLPWLCGMDEGLSDICGRYYAKPHFWDYVPAEADKPLHLLHLISRKRLTDGVWRDVSLTSQQKDPVVVSTIDGWFSPQCGEVYRREAARASVLVEIGSWRGRSLSFLTDLIKSGDLTAFAVDTWQGNSTATDPTHGRDVFAEFLKNMGSIGIADKLNVYRETSLEAAARFDDESVDVVMIDADHSFEFISRDISAWWPKVRPGGVLMGHDYSPAMLCPDVVRAVRDFAGREKLTIGAEADMWLLRKPYQVRAAANG